MEEMFKQSYAKRLIRHCSSKSVMNILSTIIQLPNNIEVKENDEKLKNWLNETF